MKLRQPIVALALLALSSSANAQNSIKSELFGKEWNSPYLSTIHSGNPLESAFPNGFKMELKGNMVIRDWYVLMPGTTDTFNIGIDTFDLKNKTIAYSKGGRRIESTAALASDQNSINFVRHYYSAQNPAILEFTYHETIRLLEDGSAILEKEGTSDDPNSNFIFVGEKKYPKPEKKIKTQ